MENNLERWIRVMRIGQLLHCHQMPERSFFCKGYQLPVCARCLGVIIGHIIAIILILFIDIPLLIGIGFCVIMFVDWLLQYLNIMESTNIRRLITGIFGGMGVIIVSIWLLKYIYVSLTSI